MSKRVLTKFGVVTRFDEKQIVDGFVYGIFGVNRPIGSASDEGRDITHLPTGRRVIRLYKDADALQLFCERLQAAVDLDTDDVNEAAARLTAWAGESKTALQDLADECGADLLVGLEDDDDADECCYQCDDLRDRLYDSRLDLSNLRRELLTLSETLSTTTIMATARRLRELGEGA